MIAESKAEVERTIASVIHWDLRRTRDWIVDGHVQPGPNGAAFVLQVPPVGAYAGRRFQVLVTEVVD